MTQRVVRNYRSSPEFIRVVKSIAQAAESAQAHASALTRAELPVLNRALANNLPEISVSQKAVKEWVRNIQAANPGFTFTATDADWEEARENEPEVFEALEAEDVKGLAEELQLTQDQVRFAIWLLLSFAYVAVVLGISAIEPYAGAVIAFSDQFTGYPSKFIDQVKEDG